jgi:serine/threonine protein kinase
VQESAKESGIAAAGVARSFSAVKAREIRYTRLSQLKQLVEIYSGSISNVYKSVCVESGTRVVVKVYHKDKMTAKQHHKLQREIEIQTRIKDCPHVCQLLGVFSTTGEVYLVLESCDGGDLFKALMKAGGRLPEATVCTDIIVPLLRVLESLNKLSILHRDIKPENIFLTADGMMKLGDFGLAIDSTQEIPFCRSGAHQASRRESRQK